MDQKDAKPRFALSEALLHVSNEISQEDPEIIDFLIGGKRELAALGIKP